MASILWTVGARKDLRDVLSYVAADSPTYAALTADRILEAIERLRRYPKLGRVVPEFDRESVREIIVGNYRVVYHLRRQRISILAIVHGSRDLLRRTPTQPWDFG